MSIYYDIDKQVQLGTHKLIKMHWIRVAVVGEKERSNETVNVRTRDNKVHGEFTLTAVQAKFKELSDEKILNSEEWDKKEE